MNSVEISLTPVPPVDDTGIHQLEYIDREHWFTVCVGQFKRIHNISEIKPGDKFISVTERTMNQTPMLWELEKITHDAYLKIKGHKGSYAWWNCYRMIEG